MTFLLNPHPLLSLRPHPQFLPTRGREVIHFSFFSFPLAGRAGVGVRKKGWGFRKRSKNAIHR